MASLSAHLRQTEGHARLPFHPACPVCRRERLAGELPSDALVSRRTQAAIAVGLLAFSSVAPGAVAAETDQTTEGSAVPGEVVGDGSQSPDFDPGGESVDLPVEVPVAPQVPAPADTQEDVEPLEPEPVIDEAPIVERGEAPTTVGEEPPPATPVVEEPVAPAPHPHVEPETTKPDAVTPSGARSDGAARRSEPRRVARPVNQGHVSAPARVAPPVPSTSPTNDVGAASAPVQRAATPTVVVAGTQTGRANSGDRFHAGTQTGRANPGGRFHAAQTGRANPGDGFHAGAQTGRAKPGDRFHVVRPGESLWSIAADVLGEPATVARIAREVNRLWRLNEERIATGDRNLLLVGTRLRLG